MDFAALSPTEQADLIEQARRSKKARRTLAKSNGADFNAYVLKDEETKEPIQNAAFHYTWHDMIDRFPRLVLWSHIEAAKALDVRTPIPAPGGWTTMGALEAGALVFAGDGRPCTVTSTTSVMFERDVYRVVFDDGAELLADAEHQWSAMTVDDANRHRRPPRALKTGDGPPCACGCDGRTAWNKKRRAYNAFIHNHHTCKARSLSGWRTVTTAQILAEGLLRKSGASRRAGGLYDQYKWRIPLAGTAKYPERALLVHPYVLGAWLGDGTKRSTTITFHLSDRAIFDRCAGLVEGRCWMRPDGRRPKVMSGSLGITGRKKTALRSKLRSVGVLKNKHIPAEYLTASRAQRLELLAGLLDTDGTVDKKGHVSFTNTNERLARDVLELVRSLGFKASISDGVAKLDGRAIGPYWKVSFRAYVPVFHLRRKLRKQKLGEPYGRTRYRSIVAIERVESVPVKCITVDSPDHTYLAGTSYTVTHNTQSVSIGRSLHELAKNPDIRIAICSNAASQSKAIVTAIKGYIENDEELREIAHLEPGPLWSTEAITVKRQSRSKDPSVQALSVGGAALGKRVDLLILDDVLNYAVTRTKAQREELERWYKATLGGRITRRGRVIAVGTAWHPEDLMHHLAKGVGWMSARFPVRTESGRLNWPERWDDARIAQAIADLSSTAGSKEADRQLFCKAVGDYREHIEQAWIDRCLANGHGYSPIFSLSLDERRAISREGGVVVIGIDPASGKTKRKRSTAKTVFFALLVYGNGDHQPLWVEGGHFSAPTIRDMVVDYYRRYGGAVWCESNAVQSWMREIVVESNDIPMYDFETQGHNKHDPVHGISSIAVQLSNGKWIIPSEFVPDKHTGEPKLVAIGEELHAAIRDIKWFNPNSHTGDYHMAAWFAKEGARLLLENARAGASAAVA